MNTKIFCDIADLPSIAKFNKKNIVKGFTTNPSLMRKAGAKDYKSYSKQILKVCTRKPISFEVFADDQKSMIDQGKKINTWGKNVYVKVPVVNSKSKFINRKAKIPFGPYLAGGTLISILTTNPIGGNYILDWYYSTMF